MSYLFVIKYELNLEDRVVDLLLSTQWTKKDDPISICKSQGKDQIDLLIIKPFYTVDNFSLRKYYLESLYK